MKTSSVIAAFGLLVAGVVSSLAGTPLLRYEFDTPGSVQQSTGSQGLSLTTLYRDGLGYDYITNAPVQRAGSSTSKALNFTAANVNQSSDQGYGTAYASLTDTNASFLRGDLESFTISLWVLGLRSDLSNINPRLFGLRNAAGADIVSLQFAPGTTNKLTLVLNGAGGQIALKPDNVTVPLSDTSWFFLSLTYDAQTGLVTFYGGTEGGALVSETASNIIGGSVNTLLGNATILGIAGLRSADQRRASGYFSDFQFYDEALTAQQVGQLFAIPEPATPLILGAGFVLVGLSRWNRRRC